MALQLVPLHARLDLVPSCVSLLQEEWPRGNYDRLEECELCCPNGPCSLVLLSNQDGDRDQIISHLRIVPVQESEEMLYIERVVTWKSFRGKGFGRKMMEMLENYCSKLGYTRLHLRTSPRTPRLYLRLGYKFTESRPVMMGSGILGDTIPVPLSVAYPGLEEFHIPYDGCQHLSREKSHPSCKIIPSGTGSDGDGADGTTVHLPSSGNFDMPSWPVGTNGQGSIEVPPPVGDIDVPSWSIDAAGHCHLQKVISVVT
ncbi:N-alpha-acetyltransferase 80-like [Amphiura filiformis]|uniref:N-alpha-acetyltransferase 80-like n=1 Tax=Amphiura filiformis TaxID=82378 RepID=UPI003B22438F